MRIRNQRISYRYCYISTVRVLAVGALFILATTPVTVVRHPRAVAAVSPPPVATLRSGGLQAAPHPSPSPSGRGWSRRAGTGEGQTSAPPRLVESFGKLPLSFEANQGQTDSQVKFLSRGRGYTLFLTGTEAVLALRTSKSKVESQKSKGKDENLAQYSLLNAAALPRSFPGGQLQRTTDYGPRTTDAFFAPLIQNPKSQIQNLLAGPESLFTTHETRNPKTENRQLSIGNSRTPSPEPRALEVLRLKLVGANPNARVTGLDPLPGKSNYFLGNDPKKWRTNVSNYAKVKYEGVYPGIDLVYYGKQGRLEHDFAVSPGASPGAIKLAIEGAEDISVDESGNIVAQVSGGRVVLNKPLIYQNALLNPKSPIQNRKSVEGRYTLIAKNEVAFEVPAYDRTRPLVIDPVLSYSTYLGGSGEDELWRMAVDSSGNAYVTGYTQSPDFPIPNAYQNTNNGAADVFVTKLNPTGTALTYSTYLGGTYSDVGYGIAVDASGSAYLTGYTDSSDFPHTTGAYQTSMPGYYDSAFVTKLNSSGSLVYSTFLGGNDEDWGTAIAVDSSGQAYVTGSAYSSDFPTTTSGYDTSCGTDGQCNYDGTHAYGDVFVTKLNSSGSGLLYSTYLGGSGYDLGYALAVDSSGYAYVTGFTQSPDFPTKSAYDSTCGTDGQCHYDGTYLLLPDAFVTKIDPSQSGAASLVYSTYLGGSDSDVGNGVAVDSSGNAYVTGVTTSTDFPVTSGAYHTSLANSHCFVTKLNSSGSALVYSANWGGNAGTEGMAIAVDSSGNAYVLGYTFSSDFPTTPNALQAANAGAGDLVVSRLNAAGSALEYSTYFGGSGYDYGTSIALGPSGSVYVAGYTYSPYFPTTVGAWDTTCGTDGNCNYDGTYYYADGFVAKAVLPPLASVAPSSLNFPSTVVNATSASLAVTVSNTGGGTLTISSITVTGTNASDFAGSGCTSGAAAGSSCSINVTFTPTAVGTRTATLTITHDAPGSPALVSLSGTGADFTLAVDPATRSVTAGGSTTYTLTVTPVSGFNQAVALTCTKPAGLTLATCSVSPSSVTPPVNNTATVTVTTTAASMVGPNSGPRLAPPSTPARWLWLLALGTLAALAAARRRRVLLALGAALLLVVLWATCGGGGGGNPGTTRGTYTLTFTGTCSGVQKSTTTQLTVN